MQSNKNSYVEKEIPEQPDQSAARRSAKRDRVRRRRSCETEEQTVARRAADRSRAKRRLELVKRLSRRSDALHITSTSVSASSITSPRDAAAVTIRKARFWLVLTKDSASGRLAICA